MNGLASSSAAASEQSLIADALRAANDTRALVAEEGARSRAAEVFAAQFDRSAPAILVADGNTWAAAGKDASESFSRAGRQVAEPFLFGDDVYADERCARMLETALAAADAIPVAIGSGTINDLTKLAAHRVGRPYMVVATAASMDGYTAYGASITASGSKQTFDCPAPRAVVADLEVIGRAPAKLNAAGYADLVAKVPAGADWLLADALGVEPIERAVWDTVQSRLHAWIDAPEKVARGDSETLRRLVNGLMMSGFAMQAARSSRPASGAEHQFSHLWDMQHHTHEGAAPSHGFKVGIGSLASVALYEVLLQTDISALDIDAAAKTWPSLASLEQRITELLGPGELADKAREETRAKYTSAAEVRHQLQRLRSVWSDLKQKLERQLVPFQKLKAMLRAAGCPHEPEQIGISRQRLKQSFEQALYIRRRFTVLDLMQRAGLLDRALDRLFAPGGHFP